MIKKGELKLNTFNEGILLQLKQSVLSLMNVSLDVLN